ncbi:MAG: hypothetical protein K6B68_11825 [Eubacterium sp.]|nr:hypothetical protein [Eubacterium sp.]
MLLGPDGQIVSKMTWEKFALYQRWDEWPERKDDPPMTVDFSFFKDGKLYYCTSEDRGFVIVDKDWNRLGYNKNLLKLLETPIWDGKSFHDCIDEILFEE